jgi:hypothetical protein
MTAIAPQYVSLYSFVLLLAILDAASRVAHELKSVFEGLILYYSSRSCVFLLASATALQCYPRRFLSALFVA